MWALDIVMSKYSFNLSWNKNELFATMFFDSEVVSCVKTKCIYLVNYRIAPYFLKLLNTQLLEVEHFVALFEKS